MGIPLGRSSRVGSLSLPQRILDSFVSPAVSLRRISFFSVLLGKYSSIVGCVFSLPQGGCIDHSAFFPFVEDPHSWCAKILTFFILPRGPFLSFSERERFPSRNTFLVETAVFYEALPGLFSPLGTLLFVCQHILRYTSF